MAFVGVRRSTDLSNSDRFEREEVPRRGHGPIGHKALTKTAAEAVGLPPEEAGGGQSSSRVRNTERFRSAPSLAKLFCGLWLWAVG